MKSWICCIAARARPASCTANSTAAAGPRPVARICRRPTTLHVHPARKNRPSAAFTRPGATVSNPLSAACARIMGLARIPIVPSTRAVIEAPSHDRTGRTDDECGIGSDHDPDARSPNQ
jgi:hypothetical protein